MPADPINLEIVTPPAPPAPPTPPVMARSQINNEQLQALIALIASANLVVLPEGKTWPDVKGFNVAVLPNGSGIVNTRF